MRASAGSASSAANQVRPLGADCRMQARRAIPRPRPAQQDSDRSVEAVERTNALFAIERDLNAPQFTSYRATRK
jgi:hypothetical protein